MRYNEGAFTYTRDSYNDRDTGGIIRYPEYAEMKYVKTLATRVTILEERESKIANQVTRDKANIEDAFEQIRYNYQAVQDLCWRIKELEDAPSVAKRKRRVTICANGQKVEVCRYD